MRPLPGLNRHPRRSQNPKLHAGLLLPLSLSALTAFGQTGNGRVRGTVSDPSQQRIASARVVLRNANTGAEVVSKTNGSGEFVFPQVPLGQYELHVAAPGFSGFDQTGVLVTADQNLTLPISLSVGGANKTVAVTEAGSLVDTQTGTLKSIIDQKSIVDLPLANRDPRALIALSQGVAATAPTFNSS